MYDHCSHPLTLSVLLAPAQSYTSKRLLICNQSCSGGYKTGSLRTSRSLGTDSPWICWHYKLYSTVLSVLLGVFCYSRFHNISGLLAGKPSKREATWASASSSLGREPPGGEGTSALVLATHQFFEWDLKWNSFIITYLQPKIIANGHETM